VNNPQSFQAQQKGESFQTEVATIDEVTEEDEVLTSLSRGYIGVVVNVDTGVCTLSSDRTRSTGATTGLIIFVFIFTTGRFDTTIRLLNLLLQLRVGNLGWRLEGIGVEHCGWGFDIRLTGHTTCNTEEFE